ncbi:MAG: hypothetical protein WC823_03735 [Parcubacteria group bacterium]|jgi:hypothetical protein
MKTSKDLLEKQIADLAEEHRTMWKENLCESEDIEEFGQNEFFGGKADAFEECLEIIKKYNKHDKKTID